MLNLKPNTQKASRKTWCMFSSCFSGVWPMAHQCCIDTCCSYSRLFCFDHPLPHPPQLHLETVCPLHAELGNPAFADQVASQQYERVLRRLGLKATSRRRTCPRTHAKACQAHPCETMMLVKLCFDACRQCNVCNSALQVAQEK